MASQTKSRCLSLLLFRAALFLLFFGALAFLLPSVSLLRDADGARRLLLWALLPLRFLRSSSRPDPRLGSSSELALALGRSSLLPFVLWSLQLCLRRLLPLLLRSRLRLLPLLLLRLRGLLPRDFFFFPRLLARSPPPSRAPLVPGCCS